VGNRQRIAALRTIGRLPCSRFLDNHPLPALRTFKLDVGSVCNQSVPHTCVSCNKLVVVGQRKITGGLQPVGEAACGPFLGTNPVLESESGAFLIVVLAMSGVFVI
jgi:hypothetical protein